ncbi:hypothetical protein UFOVP1165_54 [uncultured Caudovirales phage]|uniref:Uncharacterized protein n=1 Tax=uncultured Caudovirales phage TaxID=2100421 RepID=A0A6J5R3M4_9CAUD|nr:hypothetical protein UFOVP1165_54 [uncultured Caudovirales phage]
MTMAQILYPSAGSQPVGNSSSIIEVADNDTLYRPLVPPGTVVGYNYTSAQGTSGQGTASASYGSGTAIRLAIPKNTTAIKVGTLAITANAANAGITTNHSYVICPSTASQNRQVFVALNAVPLNASAVQYAWFGVTGTGPVWGLAATATTDKMHISATAGAVFVTATLGRLLIGLTPIIASTGTIIKSNVGIVSGSPNLAVSDADGLFVGQSVAGTGITTSLITAISADGRTVTLASNSTVTGSTTATATNNDATNFFPICTYQNGITAQFLAT